MVHNISHAAPVTHARETSAKPVQAPPPPKKADVQDSVHLSDQAKASLDQQHGKGR